MISLALLRPDGEAKASEPRPVPWLSVVDDDLIVAPTKRFLTARDSFPEQWEAIQEIVRRGDERRDVMLLTARQAAKTSTLLLAAVEMATRHPGSRFLYVSYDLATGLELIYEPAQAWLAKLGWHCKARQGGAAGLRITVENGSIIQCRSADDLRSAGRLRGRGWWIVAGDEIQEYPSHIAKKLFVDVLGPTLLRWKGKQVLAFTPPDTQAGWLWDEHRSGRWKVLGWPQTKNPFLPPGEAERWMAKRGLTIDHPVARREILGLWEPDTEKQVFEFSYQLNVWDPGNVAANEPAPVPVAKDLPPDKWLFGFGGDIGWEHLSSVTFLAWNQLDVRKRLFEILTLQGPKWLLDDWFKVLMDFRLHIKRKPFRAATMDQAGAGAMNVIHSIAERFQRMGLPVDIAYKPANVPASVGLMNDHLRTARLLVRKDSPLLAEFPQTMWKDGSNRQEIDKAKFDPHGLDGCRYAVWAAENYAARQPPPDDPNRPTAPDELADYEREQAERRQGAAEEQRRAQGRY